MCSKLLDCKPDFLRLFIVNFSNKKCLHSIAYIPSCSQCRGWHRSINKVKCLWPGLPRQCSGWHGAINRELCPADRTLYIPGPPVSGGRSVISAGHAMAVVPFMVLSAALLGGPRQQLQQQLTGVQQQLTEVQQQQQQQLTGVQQLLTALQGQLSAVQQQQTEMQDLMLPVPDTPGPASAAPTAEGCPVNWVGIDDNCYMMSPGKATWLVAKQACPIFEPRANLASFHSDNKDHVRMLFEASEGRDVWIGLFKLHHSGGSWGWTDGTPLDYIDWYPGEPNNVNEEEHCGVVWHQNNTQWFDDTCSDLYNFLCQINLKWPQYFCVGGLYGANWSGQCRCNGSACVVRDWLFMWAASCLCWVLALWLLNLRAHVVHVSADGTKCTCITQDSATVL